MCNLTMTIIFRIIVSFSFVAGQVQFGPISVIHHKDRSQLYCQFSPSSGGEHVGWQVMEDNGFWRDHDDSGNPTWVTDRNNFWRCFVTVNGSTFTSWITSVVNDRHLIESRLEEIDDDLKHLEVIEKDLRTLEKDFTNLDNSLDMVNILITEFRDQLIDEITGTLLRTRHLFDNAVVDIHVTKILLGTQKSFRQSGAFVNFHGNVFVISTRHGISKKMKIKATNETYFCRNEIRVYTNESIEVELHDTGHIYHNYSDIALLRVKTVPATAHVWSLSKEPPHGKNLRGVTLFEKGNGSSILLGYVKRTTQDAGEPEKAYSNVAGIKGFSGTAYVCNGDVVAIHRGDGSGKVGHSGDANEAEHETLLQIASETAQTEAEEFEASSSEAADYTTEENNIMDGFKKIAREMIDLNRQMSRNPTTELVPVYVLFDDHHLLNLKDCPP